MPKPVVKKTRTQPKKAAAKKTRAQWAADIRVVYTATVKALAEAAEGTLKMGRTLIAAKRALPHGEFEAMIERDLPFGASTAQRLMKIARDKRLQKAARAQLLPTAWTTLYELTLLSDTEFAQAMAAGKVHPQMKRSDVAYFKEGPSRPAYDLEKMKAAMVVYPDRPLLDQEKLKAVMQASERQQDLIEATRTMVVHEPTVIVRPTSRAEHLLRQIEKFVNELNEAVERGEVAIDAAFVEHVRSIAEQLQAMAPPCDHQQATAG